MTRKLATLTSKENITIITLDDGKANVFSPAMIEDINDCLDRVPTNKGALIITGREGILSGGFDLKIISSGDMKAIHEMTSFQRGIGFVSKFESHFMFGYEITSWYFKI